MTPSLARTVGRNTLIQFVGKVFGTALGVATIGYIQRYLAPTGYGAYTTAMAYVGFFSVVADLGLYIVLIRELNVPGADEDRVVGNLLAIRWLSALIILTLGALAVWLMPYGHQVKVAVIIATVSFVAVAATQLLTGVFQHHLAMVRMTTAELVGRVALLGSTIWAVSTHQSLYHIMLAVVIGSIANFALVWWSARRYVTLKLRYERAYWIKILRDTWPIAISVVLNLIYFRADTLILAIYHSPYDVGLYGAAYKILEILITFPMMFVGLLLPALAGAFAATDQSRFVQIFQRGFDVLLMAVVPLLIGGWILATPVLVAIGQAQFAPAAPVLRMLLIAVSASYLNSLSAHAVTIINRQRQMVWSYLSVAVVGLAVYFLFIPRFTYFGAAAGTILTECATAIVGYILVLRVMRFRLSLSILPKLLLSAAVMSAVLYVGRGWNFWLVAFCGAVIYVVMIIITRALPIATLREILHRSGPETAILPPPTS